MLFRMYSGALPTALTSQRRAGPGVGANTATQGAGHYAALTAREVPAL
jgi:hypothetical protein